MKNNQQTFPGEEQFPPGNDLKEQLRLENDLLRLKLRAEYGSDVRQSNVIPPEVEHQFLKNILTFEQLRAQARSISVFDFIGRPLVKKVDEIDEENIAAACERLIALLAAKSITIDFGSLKSARIRYAFITRKLFCHEIHDIQMPGMFLHFVYEEFYQD